MICKESNVNISAISFYFGSKDSLYQYCLQFIAERADKYYDPAYQEAVRALESGSLTKEQAFQASMKIVDAQIADIYSELTFTELAQAFAAENCTIYTMEEHDESLEAFYLSLIGGGDNA